MGRGDQSLKAAPMMIQQSADSGFKQSDCATRFKACSTSVIRSKQWPLPVVQTSSTDRSHCSQNSGKRNWKATEEALQGYFNTVYNTNSSDSLDGLLKTAVFKNTLPNIPPNITDIQYEGPINLLQNLCQDGDKGTIASCEGQQNFSQEMKQPETPEKNSELICRVKNASCDVGPLKEQNTCERKIGETLPSKRSTNMNQTSDLMKQTLCDKFTSKNQANGSSGKSNGRIKPIIVNKGLGGQTLKVANLDTLVIQPGSPTVIEVHSATCQQREQQQLNELNLEIAGVNQGGFCGFGTADGDTVINNTSHEVVAERSPSSCCKQTHNQKTDNYNNKRIPRTCKTIPEGLPTRGPEVKMTSTNNDIEYCQCEKRPCHVNQQNSEVSDQKRRCNERINQPTKRCQPLKKETSFSRQTSPVNCVPENQIAYTAPHTVNNAVLNQDQYCGQISNDSAVINENNEIEFKDGHNQLLKVTNLDTVLIQPGSPTLIQVRKSRGPQEFEHENECSGAYETDYDSRMYGDRQSSKYPDYSPALKCPKRSLKSDNERYRNANKKQNRERNYQKLPEKCQVPPQISQDRSPPMMQQCRSVPMRGRTPQNNAAPRHLQKVPARTTQNYQSPHPTPEYHCAPKTPQNYHTEKHFNQQISSNFQRRNNQSSTRQSSKRCAENPQHQPIQNSQCASQTMPNQINLYQGTQHSTATNRCPPATNQYQDRDGHYGDGTYTDQEYYNTGRDYSPYTEDQCECDASVPYSDYSDVKTNNGNWDHTCH